MNESEHFRARIDAVAVFTDTHEIRQSAAEFLRTGTRKDPASALETARNYHSSPMSTTATVPTSHDDGSGIF